MDKGGGPALKCYRPNSLQDGGGGGGGCKMGGEGSSDFWV